MARKHVNSTSDPSRRCSAIYMRVSSRKQELRSQEPDLKRWAEASGEPVRWYTDKVTGTTMDRPGWNRLWADLELGEVSRIVVWRLDRLGRTARETIPLFYELRQRGIDLLSIKDSFDLDTAAGRLFANMLASFAEYETEVRGERQAAGMAAALARGVRFGPAPGTGGRPTAVTPEKRELIVRLKRERWRVSAIARTVGLSRTTVYQVLSAPGP